MKKIRFDITMALGPPISVEGYETGVPGLAVYKLDYHGWSVTHLASGHCIPHGTVFDTRKQAVAWSQLIADLADWTLSKEEFQKQPYDGMRLALAQARKEIDNA